MIKENHKNIFLMLSGLLLLVSWFYWFQWRPSEIRKECQAVVKNKYDTLTSAQRIWNTTGANNVYNNCLVENGMKAETLFTE